MPNAPLIIETALLLLAAFLLGCVAGYALRRLTLGRRLPTPAEAAAPEVAAPQDGQLVVAPTIAPIAAVPPARRTPAQRLAAAAAGSAAVPAAPEPAAPEPAEAPPVMLPARQAGQTTSGKQVPAPIEPPPAPDVLPEAPDAPVVAAEVPPIDEAAHVLDADRFEAAPAPEPEAPAEAAPAEAELVPGIDWSKLSGVPEEELRSRLEAESEQAAMRAIEGGWTPRAAPRPHPVELPEPIRDLLPEAPAVGSAAAEPDVAGALSAVRSAVAAASAAADAALAEHEGPAAEAVEEVAAAAPRGDAQHAPFGRPPGLPAPLGGLKDDLRRIKGLTPQAETALNALGIFHFDQIAAWDRKAAIWVDNHLALKGSPMRDKWIEQARALAGTRASGFRAGGRR